MNTPVNLPNENLQSEEEIRHRIDEIQKKMKTLSPLNDYNKWLDLNNSLKILQNQLANMKKSLTVSPTIKETVEERLLREAKERYEKRSEAAGDNWWERLD
jgi:predicted  nucleic acid-binding Zn-ribbon protein